MFIKTINPRHFQNAVSYQQYKPVSYLENLVRIFLVWCGRPDLNRYGVTTEGF